MNRHTLKSNSKFTPPCCAHSSARCQGIQLGSPRRLTQCSHAAAAACMPSNGMLSNTRSTVLNHPLLLNKKHHLDNTYFILSTWYSSPSAWRKCSKFCA
jgi:hypothetical protein